MSFDATAFYNFVYSQNGRRDSDPYTTAKGTLDDPQWKATRVPEEKRKGMDNHTLATTGIALTEAEKYTALYSTLMLKQEDIVKRIRECYFGQMDRVSLEELAHELGLQLKGDPDPVPTLEDDIRRVAGRTVSATREWLRDRLDLPL